MAKLTTKERKDLKPSQFAGPDKSYPIPDKAHAANAKARAKDALDAGHISEATYKHIVRMADEKLGETPKGQGG